MVRRRDGCFLFYERECDSLAQREHGFWCTNVVDGQSRFHRIEGKPQLEASRYSSIHLCPERQLALLPVSECLLDESGDSPRIGLQLQLVALESLDVLCNSRCFGLTAMMACWIRMSFPLCLSRSGAVKMPVMKKS